MMSDAHPRQRRLSIRSLLLVASVVPQLPLLLLLASSIRETAAADLATARKMRLDDARATATHLDAFLDDWTRVAERVAKRSDVRLQPPSCDAASAEFLTLHPQFANIGIVDARGQVVCSAVPGTASVAAQRWFVDAMAGRTAYGEPFVGPITGVWVSVLAQPIFGAEGRVTGVVTLPIRLDRFYREIRGLPGVAADTATIVSIASNSGRVIARSHDHEARVGTDIAQTDIGKRVLASDEGSTTAIGMDGVERIYGFTRSRVAGWHVYSGSPSKALLAPARERAWYAAGFAAMAALAALALALVLGGRINRSVAAVAVQARRLAAGEEVTARVDGPAEVAAIADALNAMVDARARVTEEVKWQSLLLDSTSDAVIGGDERGVVHYWNRAAERQYGYSEAEAKGRLAVELVSTMSASASAAALTSALSEGCASAQTVHRHKDGRLLDVDVAIFTLRSRGAVRVFAVCRDVSAQRRAEVERQRLLQEVTTLSHRLLDVQEAERRNLARELHDEVGQLLTGLKLTLEISQQESLEIARGRVASAVVTLQTLIGAVRELSLQLRPAMLDDLGLMPTLRWLVGRYGGTHQIQLAQNGADGRFAPDLEVTAYRIVQEALTNAARHAQAKDVRVAVHASDSALTISVSDDGVGFDPGEIAGPSAGLLGIKERARLMHGSFELISAPGRGTRISVVLPLRVAC